MSRALLLLLCWAAAWAVAAPVITGGVAAGVVGAPFVCAIVATGTPSHYDAPGLPAGLTVNTVTGLITGTPTAAAVTVVTISATNAGGTGTATLTITVTAAAGPQPTNAALIQVSAGSACSFQLVSSAAATGWVVSGLPVGLSVDAAGLISGSAATSGVSNVTASANTGTTNTTLVIDILSAVTGAPVFTLPIQPQSVTGAPFAFALSATGATGFACANLPTWLSVGSTNGLLEGTPVATSATVNLQLTATIGPAATTTVIAIPFVDPDAGDAIPSAPAVIDATVGSGVGWGATASVAGSVFTSSGFPAGLSMDTTSGILSGAPTTAGTTNILLTANAGGATTARTTTMVARVQAAVVGAPVISSMVPPSLTVGGPCALIVHTTGTTPTSFSVFDTSGTFSITSSGVITGTPASAGSIAVRVTASAAAGSSVTTLLATIQAVGSDAPLPTTPLEFTGTAGSTFAAAFPAAAVPSSWSATGLPTGIALAPLTGYITGTPTTAEDANIPLSISGATTSNQTNALIRIGAAASGAPVISTAGPWFLTANQPGNIHFAASNSPTWTASGVPTGLTLDATTGDLSGTATTAAVTSLVVTATRLSASATTAALVIVEAAVTGAPVFSLTSTMTGTVGTAFSASIAASASPLEYTASPLPAGLTLNTSTGAITGTPITADTTTTQISARNTSGTTRTTIIIGIAAAASSSTSVTGPAVSGVSGGCGASGGLAGMLVCFALLPWLRRKDSSDQPADDTNR